MSSQTQRIDVQQKASCSAVGTRQSQYKSITSAPLFVQRATRELNVVPDSGLYLEHRSSGELCLEWSWLD
eukprot:12590-Heterococcus_DN1.PRE.7